MDIHTMIKRILLLVTLVLAGIMIATLRGQVRFEDKPISLRQCTMKCFALVDEATRELELDKQASVAVRFWRINADGKKGLWHIYYAEDEGFIEHLRLGKDVEVEWWEGRLPK